MFKQEKGITLVALVITIIVLIILAGISISIALGPGGLINKTTEGAEKYNSAAIEEQKQLDAVNATLDKYTTPATTSNP